VTRTLLLFALFLLPAFVPRCASGAEMARVTVGPGETAAVRTWLTEPDGGLQIWTSTSTSTSTAIGPWCGCQDVATFWMFIDKHTKEAFGLSVLALMLLFFGFAIHRASKG
jgi:hypothetical protein